MSIEKKNIIILVLSHYDEPYVMLENCIKETWANHSLDNVKVFFYHGGKKEKIDGDKILTTYPEGWQNIGYKTIRAFEILSENYSFDYIFRTNSSSYVNIEKLMDFLKYRPTNNFYAGRINRPTNNFYAGRIHRPRHLNKYCSGSGYFLSADLVKKIIENKDNWNHDMIDDVAIAELLKNLGANPINAPRKDIHKLPLPNDLEDHFHFRCKTPGQNADRRGDVATMKELHNYFLNKIQATQVILAQNYTR